MRGCGFSIQCCLFSLSMIVECSLPQGWSPACSGERVEFGVLLIDMVVANSRNDAPHGDGVDGKVKALLLLPRNQVQDGRSWVAPCWGSMCVKSELARPNIQLLGERVNNMVDPDQCKADRVVHGSAHSILYGSNTEEASTEVVEIVCADDQGEIFFPDL